MDWNIGNVDSHCFYCGQKLDVGGLHGMEAVYFHGRFVCRVFSHSDCMVKYEKELNTDFEKENAELKQKLEDVQATAYAESVDAGMRERSLKRALWMARAERAADKARIFYFCRSETRLDIDGYAYDNKKKNCCKKITAREWRIIWLKVERLCRTKAEEC